MAAQAVSGQEFDPTRVLLRSRHRDRQGNHDEWEHMEGVEAQFEGGDPTD
jgi:hypothetical protein